jgi:hypothetical protein
MKKELFIQSINAFKHALRNNAIESMIRQKYSVSDELAILRQKDEKPEEYQEYYNFVESIKAKFK